MSDKMRLPFQGSLCTIAKAKYLQIETAFNGNLEATLNDVVSSHMTGRNALRLRMRAATNFCRCLQPRKCSCISICGSYSLQFSDSMSDVTCTVVQTPAETHYFV